MYFEPLRNYRTTIPCRHRNQDLSTCSLAKALCSWATLRTILHNLINNCIFKNCKSTRLSYLIEYYSRSAKEYGMHIFDCEAALRILRKKFKKQRMEIFPINLNFIQGRKGLAKKLEACKLTLYHLLLLSIYDQ